MAEGETESTPVSNSSLEAKYANYFEIGYNEWELVMDFGQLYSPDSSPALHTRIITGPSYGKALLELLSKVLNDHQHKFGVTGTGKRVG